MNKVLFNNTAAQGDVYFRKVTNLPEGVKKVVPEGNKLVVTHSETGHNHVMGAEFASMYETENPLVCYLYIEQPTALEHLRTFDTHAPIMFAKGVYEVRRQREYVPEGFRKVED